jgi:hypothetical protein
MLNSAAIADRAGATIEDETGEMNVKDDTTIVAAHFLLKLQFFGFSGSLGPCHETYISLAICSGILDTAWYETYKVWVLH